MPTLDEGIKRDVVDQPYWDSRVVEGVSKVENQLKVAPSPAPARASDEHIRVSIAQAYRRDENLDEDRIEVSDDTGIVTLEGTVDLFWKKGLAEESPVPLKSWRLPNALNVPGT